MQSSYSLICSESWSGPPQSQRVRSRAEKAKASTSEKQIDLMDSDDESPMPAKSKRDVLQTQQVRASARKDSHSRTDEAQPLFLASDGEENTGNKADAQSKATGSESESENVLRAIGRRTQNLKSNTKSIKKRSAVSVPLDDDSDDGVAFKGFGARKKARR